MLVCIPSSFYQQSYLFTARGKLTQLMDTNLVHIKLIDLDIQVIVYI